MIKLYDAENCPCKNVNCARYKDCEPCIAFHHSNERYPQTACEYLATKEQKQK